MRWLRSFSLAFILFGLSFFAIDPCDAYAKNYVETNDADLYYMWFTEDEMVNGLPPYKGWASLNRVLDYNYSATDIIDTHSEVSADYVLAMSHTGAFGGYLDVPSVNTTASGTISTVYQSDGNNNGLAWDTNWWYAPYKPSSSTEWGYKPQMSSSTDHYNAWKLRLQLSNTSNMTAAGYHVDMSHATHSMNSTGTQTKEEEADTDGTLHHDEFYTNNYKMIPYDGTGDYLYVCLASPNSANVGIKDTQFYMPNTIMDYFRDGPNNPRAAFRYYKLCAITTNNRVLQGTEDGYITFDRAYKYVGVLYSLNNATKPTNYILMSAPKFYVVDTETEKTIRTETQTQTQELKDTTGSDTVLGSAQSAGQQLSTKLGFVSQVADMGHTLWDGVLGTSANSTLQFPGIQWAGNWIVQPQQVNLFQYLGTEVGDKVKLVNTILFILAWLRGVMGFHDRVLGDQFAGSAADDWKGQVEDY